jgi:hypothetical protein
VAENSSDAAKKRGPGRPFEPGQSGNPGGRAKKSEALSVKISEMDDAHRARLEDIAANGEHRDSIQAIRLLWSYAHGLPRQVVTDASGGPVIDVAALVQALDRAAKDGDGEESP